MGLLDFLLFGAFMNSLRNNQNNNHSDFSNRSYNQGYEDYHCHDDYDCSDSCDCDTDCDDYFDF